MITMDMSSAQAWIAIIGVVFTGLTGLITLFFAALSSRDSKKASESALQAKLEVVQQAGALQTIHTVVNSNFAIAREEIAAQAREISSLRGMLVNNEIVAARLEDTRANLASEAAAVLAATPVVVPVVEPSVIIKPGEPTR